MQKKIYSKNADKIELLSSLEEQQIIESFDNFELNREINIPFSKKITYLIITKKSKININLHLKEDNTNLEFFVIWLSKDKENCTFNIQTNIESSNTIVNIYMLWLLWDHANTNMSWNVILSANISKSAGHLQEEKLILWKNVKINSIPRLDVYSSDIQASHWLKIHKLDDEKLFYMQSKGLSTKQSKQLITKSHINSILDKFTSFEKKELSRLEEDILAYLHSDKNSQ